MKRLVLLFSCLILSGCLKTRNEINEIEDQKAVQSQITEIRQSKADQEMRVQNYEGELRNMNGRIEVLERKLSEKNQTQTLEQKENSKQIKDLMDQMKIFEDSLAVLNQRIEKIERAPKAEAKVESSNPEKKKSTWEKAEQEFIKKDWKNAALSYQSYIETNPKGANAPTAIYKIGVCFQELKMKDDAKSFFEEVVTKYPNSSSAKKAKNRLNQLK